jgi:hypothetical protein
VAGLREPISLRQAGVILLAGAVLVVSQRWLGPMPNLLGWFLLTAVLEFVVQPVSTLIHELGHAAAVVALTGRPANVMVGRGPWLTLTAGQITVRFSPLPTRGVRIAGVCRHDPQGASWATLGWIALAGPLATLAELLTVLAIAPLVWGAGAFARYLLLSSVIMLVESLVRNLLPRGMKSDSSGRAVVAVRDGVRARMAFERHRSGAACVPTAVSLAAGSTNHAGDLPPHWVPSDPEQRRVFEDELRRALRPAAPDEDPAERRRLEAQLRVALMPPDQARRRLAEIEQQRDQDRVANSVPPPRSRDQT